MVRIPWRGSIRREEMCGVTEIVSYLYSIENTQSSTAYSSDVVAASSAAVPAADSPSHFSTYRLTGTLSFA